MKTNNSVMLLSCGRTVNNSGPFPTVLVKFWKVAHWNAKKLLPKFQKLRPINVNYFSFFTIISNIGQEKKNEKIEVFYEIVDLFVLNMCSKPIFCSKGAQKGKICSRLP